MIRYVAIILAAGVCGFASFAFADTVKTKIVDVRISEVVAVDTNAGSFIYSQKGTDDAQDIQLMLLTERKKQTEVVIGYEKVDDEEMGKVNWILSLKLPDGKTLLTQNSLISASANNVKHKEQTEIDFVLSPKGRPLTEDDDLMQFVECYKDQMQQLYIEYGKVDPSLSKKDQFLSGLKFIRRAYKGCNYDLDSTVIGAEKLGADDKYQRKLQVSQKTQLWAQVLDASTYAFLGSFDKKLFERYLNAAREYVK